MSCICAVRSLAMLVCLGVGSTPQAQSIDPTSAQLALHQPFALRLLIRTDAPLNSTQVAACIEANFQTGHTHLVSDDMQVTLTPAQRTGWHEVLFRHPHVIEDSAVLARVVVRCPARFEREFVLEATPVAPARRLPPAEPAAQAVQPGSTTRPTATARATLSPATKPTPSPPATVTSPPGHALISAEHVALQTEITRLRHELAVARLPAPSPAATPRRSRATGPEQGLAWQPAALLVLALPLLGLISIVRRWRSTTLPRISTMDIVQPGNSPPLAPTPAACSPAAAMPIAPTVRPTPAPPHDAATQSIRPVASPIGELNMALIPPTVVPAGGASLADTGAAVFTCQVDQLVQDGYMGVAVNLLEKSLDAGPAKNPWLLLQLLGLYERLGQRSEAARLISQLQTLYRVHLPTVGGLCVTGTSLLDQPDLLAQVSRAWQSSDLVQQLEGWLAGASGPTWDLATFEDLLLLHAIAQNRPDDLPTATPDPAPRFAAVLEWTTDDH